MSPQIQKQDLEVRVNWRGHHHSRVLDFRFAVLSSCDVMCWSCWLQNAAGEDLLSMASLGTWAERFDQ